MCKKRLKMSEVIFFRKRELFGGSFDQNSLLKRVGLLNSGHNSGFDDDSEALSPVYCSKYSVKKNNEHILALANEDGVVALSDTNSWNHSTLTVKETHVNAVFDVAWMENEMKLVTVSGDQSAVLWDVSGSQISKISTFIGHKASVKTVAFQPGHNDIFVTGARDGKIIIWDTRLSHNDITNKPDNFIENAHGLPYTTETLPNSRKKKTKEIPNSIINVVFQDENTLITCGAVDGVIKVWDMRKNYSIYKRTPQPKYRLPERGRSVNGFSCLALDASRTRLYASCMDNNIYGFNVASYDSRPVSVYNGHINGSFYVKCCLSPDGRHLLSGSSDGKAYIWSTSGNQSPVAIGECHLGEVTSVAWRHSDEPQFVTCSDDMTYAVWNMVSSASESDVRSRLTWVGEKEQDKKTELVDLKENPWKSCCAAEKDIHLDNCMSPNTPRTIRKWVSVQERTPRTSSSESSAISPNTPKACGNLRNDENGRSISRKGSKRKLEEFMAIGERSNGDAKRVNINESECGPSVCYPDVLPVTPKDGTKMLTASASSPLTLSSPTQGLPNFVLDGISPHRHSCCSSTNRSKENVDWLTKLSQERRGKSIKCEKSEGSEPKKEHRRQVNFEGRTKLCSSENLLRFFRSSVCGDVSE